MLDELDALDELDFGAVEELEVFGALDEDSVSAGQFPPMQNVSVSLGVPMSVILSPVLEPLRVRFSTRVCPKRSCLQSKSRSVASISRCRRELCRDPCCAHRTTPNLPCLALRDSCSGNRLRRAWSFRGSRHRWSHPRTESSLGRRGKNR